MGWQVGKGAAKTFAHAVGDNGAGLRFKDGKWLDNRAETAAHLLSAHALKDGRVVATGASGLLLLAKDAKSPFVDLGAAVTCAALHDATDDGAGGLWAVGDGGVVVHAGKDGVTKVSVPAAAAGQNLNGAGFGSGSEVVAVGDLGTIIVWDGSTWKAEKSGLQHTLRSVSGADGKYWAVGDFGTVLRREAGKWTKESVGAGAGTKLHSIVALGGGKAVAVGDAGVVIERSADGKWKQVSEDPGLFLYGVARSADGGIVAVGWNGSLVIGHKGKYEIVKSKLPNVLRDVAITAAGIVAVGHKGGVYQVHL